MTWLKGVLGKSVLSALTFIFILWYFLNIIVVYKLKKIFQEACGILYPKSFSQYFSLRIFTVWLQISPF